VVTRLLGPRNRHRRSEGARRLAGRLRALLGRAAGGVLGLLCLAGVLPALAKAVRHHPYFAIDRIELRHRGRVPAAALHAALALDGGESIWDVDVAALERRLRLVPWVREAAVRRVFPDTLVIRVREHRPVAILSTGERGGSLFYLARDGRIFAPVGEHDGRDLPYVTGLAPHELDGRTSFGPRGIRRALALLRLVDRSVPPLGPVSEIHVGRDGGLTLLLTRPAVPIALGSAPDAAMLNRVARVLSRWAGREAELVSLSVFDEQVIVRTRTSRAPGSRGSASGV